MLARNAALACELGHGSPASRGKRRHDGAHACRDTNLCVHFIAHCLQEGVKARDSTHKGGQVGLPSRHDNLDVILTINLSITNPGQRPGSQANPGSWTTLPSRPAVPTTRQAAFSTSR